MIISILYSRQLWPEDIDSAPTNNFWDCAFITAKILQRFLRTFRVFRRTRLVGKATSQWFPFTTIFHLMLKVITETRFWIIKSDIALIKWTETQDNIAECGLLHLSANKNKQNNKRTNKIWKNYSEGCIKSFLRKKVWGKRLMKSS